MHVSTRRARDTPSPLAQPQWLAHWHVCLQCEPSICGTKARQLDRCRHHVEGVPRSKRPIDRGREMPTRKMASAPEASAPARACTARGRGAGAPARGAAERREGSAHSAPLRSVAICRVEVGLPTFRSDPADPSPRSTRRSSPRSPPLASVRARAGGPWLRRVAPSSTTRAGLLCGRIRCRAWPPRRWAIEFDRTGHV